MHVRTLPPTRLARAARIAAWACAASLGARVCFAAPCPVELRATYRSILVNRLGFDSAFQTLKTEEVSIAGTPQLVSVAQFVTWLGILLEGAIAVVFMFPPTYRMLGATRDWILLGFVGVVYPLATVLGFAYTLVAMGLAQSQRRRATWAYALCLPAMQLFGYHWSSAL